MEPACLRVTLRIWVGAVLVFLFAPILLIVLYAFDTSAVEGWPIPHRTLHWCAVAWNDVQIREAFILSVKVALLATGVALVLGSEVAYGLHRFRFFGSDAISFLLVLPLALPGIITGIALYSFFSFASIQFSLWTIMIGTATFCIVVG